MTHGGGAEPRLHLGNLVLAGSLAAVYGIGRGWVGFRLLQRHRGAPAGGAWAGSGAFGAGSAPRLLSLPASPASLVLEPAVRPGKCCSLCFCLSFWNGIVSVFVIGAVNDWRAGHPRGG